MPGRIKTFEQRPREFFLPEIGRLSIGERKQNANGKEYPVALDHFRLYGTDDRRVIDAFEETYGKTPSKLLVSFFQSNPERVCNQRFELRVGRRRFAEGDGQTFYFWNESKKQQATAEAFSEEERDAIMKMIEGEAEKYAKANRVNSTGWKQRLTLRLWLPEVPHIGEFLFDTKGAASSIKNIVNAFDMVLTAAGTVQRIPFELSVKIHDSDSMQKTRYPVVSLRPLLDGDSLRTVGELGENLFDSLREFRRGELHLLTAEDIQQGVKQLAAGTGAPIVQNMPTPDPGGEPEAELQQIAESPEAWQDVDQHKELEENSSAFNEALSKAPEEMAPADAIKYLKANTGFEDVRQRWSNLISLQGNEAVARCFWLCLIEKAPDKSALNEIVRDNPQLHSLNWFKAGVMLRRKVTG